MKYKNYLIIISQVIIYFFSHNNIYCQTQSWNYELLPGFAVETAIDISPKQEGFFTVTITCDKKPGSNISFEVKNKLDEVIGCYSKTATVVVPDDGIQVSTTFELEVPGNLDFCGYPGAYKITNTGIRSLQCEISLTTDTHENVLWNEAGIDFATARFLDLSNPFGEQVIGNISCGFQYYKSTMCVGDNIRALGTLKTSETIGGGFNVHLYDANFIKFDGFLIAGYGQEPIELTRTNRHQDGIFYMVFEQLFNSCIWRSEFDLQFWIGPDTTAPSLTSIPDYMEINLGDTLKFITGLFDQPLLEEYNETIVSYPPDLNWSWNRVRLNGFSADYYFTWFPSEAGNYDVFFMVEDECNNLFDSDSFTVHVKQKLYDITGHIQYYYNNDPVNNALIKANSSYSDTTNLNGDYELLDLMPDNYTVRPEKENDTGSSISAYDAAWILQYGVELRTFTPYQLIAGDVTGNGSVTAYDAAKILQYGVDLINQFSVMEDSTHFWRFVPEDFAITPTNWTTAPDSIAYAPLNSDTTGNYFGIIYGDVSGNWHPSAADLASLGKSSGETVDIRLEDISGETGDKVILPVVVESSPNIVAMSFTLEYDARVLKALIALTTDITENWQIAYNIRGDLIKVAMAGSKPIASFGPVVNLEFEVLKTDLNDTSSPLNISNIKINEGNVSVNIHSAKFAMGSPVPKEYNLSQNYPNPFNAQTVIKYQLPETGTVVLKIYNTLGQEVRTLVDEEKEAGYHKIIWEGRNDDGLQVSSGIYIYRIQAGDFVKVKKMLFIM